MLFQVSLRLCLRIEGNIGHCRIATLLYDVYFRNLCHPPQLHLSSRDWPWRIQPTREFSLFFVSRGNLADVFFESLDAFNSCFGTRRIKKIRFFSVRNEANDKNALQSTLIGTDRKSIKQSRGSCLHVQRSEIDMSPIDVIDRKRETGRVVSQHPSRSRSRRPRVRIDKSLVPLSLNSARATCRRQRIDRRCTLEIHFISPI